MKTWHRLRYYCADAWDEWRHSKAVNLMALVTLVAALFVAALVTLIIANIDRRIQDLRDEVRIDVYLLDDHDQVLVAELTQILQGLDGVVRVDYVGKDEALERYRAWAADMAELVGELDSNPLPASLEVYFSDHGAAMRGSDDVALALAQTPAVEEVRFHRQWIDRLESMLEVARIGGGGVAALVLIAVVFVMTAVLRLAVHARRNEIEIMQLVGATNSFIRGPFLVAGAVQGLIASVVALALVEGVRRLALTWGASGANALLDLLAAQPVPRGLVLLIVVVGMAVSLTGSWFAVREPA